MKTWNADERNTRCPLSCLQVNEKQMRDFCSHFSISSRWNKLFVWDALNIWTDAFKHIHTTTITSSLSSTVSKAEISWHEIKIHPNYDFLSLYNKTLRYWTNILNKRKKKPFCFKDKLIGLLVYLWFPSQSFLSENRFNDYLL